MSDVLDFNRRKAAELLKREAESEEEFKTQQRLANDVGINAALDMFESLGKHDVDQTDAGVTGAMSGVLYTVLRFVLDFSADADKARQYVNAAMDVAIENYEKVEL